MFFAIVLGVTFFIAAILLVLISQHDKKIATEKALLLQGEDGSLQLNFRQFTKICMDLCEIFKLEVIDFNNISAEEIAIVAMSEHPITQVQYLICCFHLPANTLLEDNKVIEISEEVIAERFSKAIIITTGRINPRLKMQPELAPMEFIDGKQLMKLIVEHKINY